VCSNSICIGYQLNFVLNTWYPAGFPESSRYPVFSFYRISGIRLSGTSLIFREVTFLWLKVILSLQKSGHHIANVGENWNLGPSFWHKNFGFFEIYSVQTDKGHWASVTFCRQGERGSIFSNYMQTRLLWTAPYSNFNKCINNIM